MRILYSHALTYYLSQIVPAVASLAGVVLYIDIAGKDAYGRFALIVSAILSVHAFFSTWLSQSILRFRTAYSSAHEERVFSDAIAVAGLWVAAAIAASSLLYELIMRDSELSSLVLLVSGLISFHYVLYSIRGVQASSRMHSKMVLVGEFTRAVATLGVSLLLLISFGFSEEIELLLGMLVGLMLGNFALHRYRGGSPLRGLVDMEVRKLLIRFLRFGVPLSIWMLIVQLHNVSDRFQINAFLGPEPTAEYSAIYDIVYKLYGFALVPILSSAHPIIMNAWNAGRVSRVIVTVTRSMSAQVVIAALTLLGLYLARNHLVSFVLGDGGGEAPGLVLPVAIGAIIWQSSMLLQKFLEVSGKVVVMVGLISLSLVTNIIGNYLLIPVYGYIAASYTTLLSAVVYMIALLIYLRLYWADLGRPVLPRNQ